MRIALRVSSMALLLAVPGAAIAQQESDPSAEMQKHFAEAYNKGDLDAMAAAFTEDAVRVTPSGIFKGRDAVRRGFQDALKLGLHDYVVRRVSSRTEGKFIFNIGECRRSSPTARFTATTPRSSCREPVCHRSWKRQSTWARHDDGRGGAQSPCRADGPLILTAAPVQGQQIGVGNGQQSATLPGIAPDVFTYRPASCAPRLLLMVFHGVERDAGPCRDHGQYR